MKTTNKFISKLLLVFFALVMVSCSEESPIGSEITYYADINPIGGALTVITEGTAFADPGATSIINGESVPYTTSGTVNANAPGVYKLTYESINDDGFAASTVRTVVVLKNSPSLYDFTGNWQRSATGTAVITRISDRLFTHSNAGGVNGPNALAVTFFNIDDVNLYIPFTPNASESGISVEMVLGTGKIINANEIRWVLNASGFYGSLTRIFKRV